MWMFAELGSNLFFSLVTKDERERLIVELWEIPDSHPISTHRNANVVFHEKLF